MLSMIPFGGFYESAHAILLENTVLDTTRVSWRPVFEAYAREYARRFCETHGIRGEFFTLTSPREYNFSTDVIRIEIGVDEVKRIHAATDPGAFARVCADRFTSGPGFVSFYDPDPTTWGPVMYWDANQVGALLEAHAGEFCELDAMDYAVNTGLLDQWLEDNGGTYEGED